MIFNYKQANNSKRTDAVITKFSNELSLKYGKGFSITNISFAVKFYNCFLEFSPAKKFRNVSWSYYREILSLNDYKRIIYYLAEINNKNFTS